MPSFLESKRYWGSFFPDERQNASTIDEIVMELGIQLDAPDRSPATLWSTITQLTLGALCILALGWPQVLRAQTIDSVLEPTIVEDMQTCLTTLQEFNWTCQEFNHGGWERSYGVPFWGHHARLLFYRHDFDGDGTEDGLLKLEYGAACSRGGRDCGHYFLFGDQPPSDHPHVFNVSGDGRPVITTRGGVKGIYFEITNPDVFHSLDDIRARTLSSDQRSIGPRGVGE